MKRSLTHFHCALAAISAVSLSPARGQAETQPEVSEPTAEEQKGDTTPPESDHLAATGNVFSIDQDTFSVTPAKVTIPLNFMYNSKTAFVDEAEKSVPWDRLHTGLPVTVNYTTLGEKFLATKVTVTRSMIDGGKASPATDDAAKKREELAEARKKKEAETAVVRAKTGQTAAGGGTIMSFEQVIAVRPEGGSEVVQYVVNNSTHYIDTAGQPVDLHRVRTGVPVNIQFVEDAGRKIATQIILETLTTPETKTGSNTRENRGNGSRSGAASANGGGYLPGTLEDGFINPPIAVLPGAFTGNPSNVAGTGTTNGFSATTPSQPAVTQPGAGQPGTVQSGGVATSPPAARQPAVRQPPAAQPKTSQPAISPAPATSGRR